MLDVDAHSHNDTLERMVTIINQRTNNMDKGYFRTIAAHALVAMASAMRTYVVTHDAQKIPVNSYAICLGVSGYSKGHSLGIIEDELTHGFVEKFMNDFFPMISDERVRSIAAKRSAKKGTDPEEEYEKTLKEYDGSGEYCYDFPEGTSPALKQMRHKLLMADAGALNFIMDEIGYNIQSNSDVLKVYMELYDKGKVKDKLIKNSKDNTRVTPIKGITPANMLMFGVPNALFDGGKVEEDFVSFLTSGFGRRCFYAYGDAIINLQDDVDSMYQNMLGAANNQDVPKLYNRFESLVSRDNYNQSITMSPTVAKLFLTYKKQCLTLAAAMPEHEALRSTEMQHREFKARKLAAAFAWHAGTREISEEDFWAAVKFTEESGIAYEKFIKRERNYEKLAKYLACVGREVTFVDLMEDLPFFRGTQGKLQEMLQYATAYGHPRHIIIRKKYLDGIEFISGETLAETDLDKLIISHSADWTTGYRNDVIPFDKLDRLTQIHNPKGDYNWINHHLIDGYRKDENAIAGFNMIVLDVDGELSLSAAQELFKGYSYHIYTTKRHTADENRFRIILPLSHVVKLDKTDFKMFMNNVFDWCPWDVKDRAANQIAKKWLTFKGSHFSNEAELLDPRQFIPATRKNEDRIAAGKGLGSLSKLERWFAVRCTEGQRSNELIKYALMLVDSGMILSDIDKAVKELNRKLKDPLDVAEIDSTIMRTVANKIHTNP